MEIEIERKEEDSVSSTYTLREGNPSSMACFLQRRTSFSSK